MTATLDEEVKQFEKDVRDEILKILYTAGRGLLTPEHFESIEVAVRLFRDALEKQQAEVERLTLALAEKEIECQRLTNLLLGKVREFKARGQQ